MQQHVLGSSPHWQLQYLYMILETRHVRCHLDAEREENLSANVNITSSLKSHESFCISPSRAFLHAEPDGWGLLTMPAWHYFTTEWTFRPSKAAGNEAPYIPPWMVLSLETWPRILQ